MQLSQLDARAEEEVAEPLAEETDERPQRLTRDACHVRSLAHSAAPCPCPTARAGLGCKARQRDYEFSHPED